MLDQALEALKTYDWGVDPKTIRAIDEAIVSSHGDAAARNDLETKLAAVLGTPVPQAAKDAVCRALRTIGTATCVPALSKLLLDEKLSHMARYALQTNSSPEATKALIGGLQQAGSPIKIGIAATLAARSRDGHQEVSAVHVAPLLKDKDPAVAAAGALALGTIGSAEAVDPLVAAGKAAGSTQLKTAVAEGLLQCAENLREAGKKGDAKKLYEQVLALKLSDASKAGAEAGIKSCS